jgi:branched-chain amino acid transport system ATP-binding protein
MSSGSILEIADVSAGYGARRVLDGVSATLDSGKILLVLGHNGAGKTTLLRAIFGLVVPIDGRVWYLGQDITGHPPSSNVAAGIAFVPQGRGIFPRLSVAENLQLGAFTVTDPRLLPKHFESVYALFPILAQRQKQPAATLSGGQQQMLAIGMALMHAPKVLVLDEPSIGLAPNLVANVMSSIRLINRTMGVSVLIVEQNVNQGLVIADQVMIMKTGRKVFDGHPSELQDRARLMQFF